MKKSFFLMILVITISCEKVNYESDDYYVYGKFIPKEKKLTRILHNGILKQEFIYDSLNRLSELKTYNSDSVIQSESYSYNSDNQIIERRYGDLTDFYKYQNELLVEHHSINDKNNEWKPKTIYFYGFNNKIIKAKTYFNNKLTGYIKFEYDENDNTTLRREYHGDLIISEYKYKYDDKTNPVQLISIHPIDVIQLNNVKYSYYYNCVMSHFPPEFTSTFTYDNDGFPVEEERHYKDRIPGTETFTYIYSD